MASRYEHLKRVPWYTVKKSIKHRKEQNTQDRLEGEGTLRSGSHRSTDSSIALLILL